MGQLAGVIQAFAMLLVILSALLFAKFATCSEVEYLHIWELNPSYFTEEFWMKIYLEIIYPIFEDLPKAVTNLQRTPKVTKWIQTIFPQAVLENSSLEVSKDADVAFKSGQLVHGDTLVPHRNGKGLVPAGKEGLILLATTCTVDKTRKNVVMIIVWFHPSFPPYDISTFMHFFDAHSLPRPTPTRLIKARDVYHPRHPSNISRGDDLTMHKLSTIIIRAVMFLGSYRRKDARDLRSRFAELNVCFFPKILETIWNLFVPGMRIIALTESLQPKDMGTSWGHITSSKSFPKKLIVPQASFNEIGQQQYLIAILPEVTLPATKDAEKFLEYYSSNKFWSYVLEEDVPEVAAFFHKYFSEAVAKAKVRDAQVDKILQRINPAPPRTPAKSESHGEIIRRSMRQASMIASRFESATVRRRVEKWQYDTILRDRLSMDS